MAGASEDWVEAAMEKSDRSFDLLPLSLQRRYSSLRSEGLWIEADSLLVPVQARSVARLVREGLIDISTDPWTTSCSYDRNVGLLLQDDSLGGVI